MKTDQTLTSHGITLDFGRIKNKNSNASVDKCIQELEAEFLQLERSGKPLTQLLLDAAINNLNHRIRSRGFSATEVVQRREQISGRAINVQDAELAVFQHTLRQQNHVTSAVSKAKGGKPATNADVNVGD